jgi:hypothetical protein
LQKHGVALRGRSAATPASAAGSASVSARKPRQTRAVSRRPVKSSDGAATAATSSAAAPRQNGTHAFSVSFRAVRVVEANSALEVVREVERLGATDIDEISRQ